MKWGIGSAGISWPVYFYLLNVIKLPEEYDWIKQAVSALPLVFGHGFLVHRYHTA